MEEATISETVGKGEEVSRERQGRQPGHQWEGGVTQRGEQWEGGHLAGVRAGEGGIKSLK